MDRANAIALLIIILIAALTAIVSMALAFRADAQTWKTLQPAPGAGVATAPGQTPMLIQPFGGGYAIGAAGQVPTLVQPFAGGWLVTPPMIPSPIAPVQFPSIGGGY